MRSNCYFAPTLVAHYTEEPLFVVLQFYSFFARIEARFVHVLLVWI